MARAALGGAGKRVDESHDPSFRYQRRPVDNCSPGRGGMVMAQDGGTMGGTFHGEMDRCRKS